MSTDAVAVLGFVALFALMLLRVPVGMAMGLVGVTGFGYLVGFSPALKLVGQTTMRTESPGISTDCSPLVPFSWAAAAGTTVMEASRSAKAASDRITLRVRKGVENAPRSGRRITPGK